MSDGIDITALPVLSSVSDADRMLIVTSSGTGLAAASTVDARNTTIFILPEASSGWIRIGRFDTEGFAILSVFGRWGSAIPQLLLIGTQAHMNGDGTVCRGENLLSAAVNNMPKARFVKSSGNQYMWLDVYFSGRFSRVQVNIVSSANFGLVQPSLVTALETGQTAIECSLVRGGVNRYFTTVYNSIATNRQKGVGAPHEYSNGTCGLHQGSQSRRLRVGDTKPLRHFGRRDSEIIRIGTNQFRTVLYGRKRGYTRILADTSGLREFAQLRKRRSSADISVRYNSGNADIPQLDRYWNSLLPQAQFGRRVKPLERLAESHRSRGVARRKEVVAA